MIEIFLVLLVLAAVLVFPWIGRWDPEFLLLLITAILNLINLGMTVINCIQARRRDRRFLSAGILGSVQIFIGLSLLLFLGFAIGPRSETWLSGFPYVLGGSLAIGAFIFSRPKSESVPNFRQ